MRSGWKKKYILNMPLLSIVLTENASYHTVLEKNLPLFHHVKSDIIMWLQNNKSVVDPELKKTNYCKL
jgi:hypothetical protein